MADKTLFVIKVKKNERWKKTWWTRQGKPVTRRVAVKAMERAKDAFPDSEYRIAEYKVKAKANPTSIARKHIMASIEAAPYRLDCPKYVIVSSLVRPNKDGGYAGVHIEWRIK